jgi:hypothetical protein
MFSGALCFGVARNEVSMFETLWQEAFDLVSGFDPRLLIMVTTVLGLIFKPTTIRTAKVMWWGGRKTAKGTKWVLLNTYWLAKRAFITPPPCPRTKWLVRKLGWTSEWRLCGDGFLMANDGTVNIDLAQRRIEYCFDCDVVNIAPVLTKYNCKRVLTHAKMCKERLAAVRLNNALVEFDTNTIVKS